MIIMGPSQLKIFPDSGSLFSSIPLNLSHALQTLLAYLYGFLTQNRELEK